MSRSFLGSAAFAALSCLCAQQPAAPPPRSAASEQEARRVIDAFFVAFNKQDVEATRRVLHFPHIRIGGGGRVAITASPQEWKGDAAALAAEGWRHSTLDSVGFTHSSADKVHAAVVFSRYRADGARYATYSALWIITRQDERWGLLCRSSFAP